MSVIKEVGILSPKQQNRTKKQPNQTKTHAVWETEIQVFEHTQ